MERYSSAQLPPKLFAEAVVRSTSGESLLRSSKLITSKNVTLFHAHPDQRLVAAERLRAAGFEVLDIGPSSINIAADPEVYERSFGANLEVVERPVIKNLGQRGVADFINSADQAPLGEIDISNTDWHTLLDGIAINEPAYFLQSQLPSSTSPQTKTRYLQVPDDLAMELGASEAHEQGITGKGVKVIIVDSGCYTEHPFFKHHHYKLNVVLGPGSIDPTVDISGHGTGVAANVLAIAPEVDLTVLKSDVALGNKSRNVNSTAAFRKAVSLRPDIISCSWGSDLRSPFQLSSAHKVLAAAIADATRRGIIVVFASGNGQWGFPSQHPDVMAVGGVFKHLEGSLKGRVEASNYASSFISAIYPGRRVPDVCGLVGRLPNAAYIMLPVPPGSDVDRVYSTLNDETETTDGWAAFSGTSSAAPQLAGACALLEQLVPKLGPLKTKQILQETAIDIIEGSSNPSTGSGQARAGPDLATGYGLAVAYAAIKVAKEQNKSQHNGVANFSQPNNGQMPGVPADFHQNSATLRESNHQEKNIMPSLDESTLRKLRLKLDEIQIDLNCYFQSKYTDLADSQIELIIHEDNFVAKKSESDAIAELRSKIQDLLNPTTRKLKNPEKIEKTHVFAAESLLKNGKCQDLAKAVLVAIMKEASGKKVSWKIDIGNGFKEIDSSIAQSNFILEPIGEYLIVTSAVNPEAQIKVSGKSIKAGTCISGIISLEIIDQDEISQLASKALGETANLHPKGYFNPFDLNSEDDFQQCVRDPKTGLCIES